MYGLGPSDPPYGNVRLSLRKKERKKERKKGRKKLKKGFLTQCRHTDRTDRQTEADTETKTMV